MLFRTALACEDMSFEGVESTEDTKPKKSGAKTIAKAGAVGAGVGLAGGTAAGVARQHKLLTSATPNELQTATKAWNKTSQRALEKVRGKAGVTAAQAPTARQVLTAQQIANRTKTGKDAIRQYNKVKHGGRWGLIAGGVGLAAGVGLGVLASKRRKAKEAKQPATEVSNAMSE